MIQKLVKLKRKILIIVLINILLLQSSISLQDKFLLQANLVIKADFNNKLISFNKNITSNKTKYLLVENEFWEDRGGESFLQAANLNLNYFWTTSDINLEHNDFSKFLLEIILLKKKLKKIKFSGGNIFLYHIIVKNKSWDM